VDEQDERADNETTQQVGRVNVSPDRTGGDVDQGAMAVWGPKAIGLGLLALIIMVAAMLLIMQGVFEVRPQ
jgi:hypothetical protein